MPIRVTGVLALDGRQWDAGIRKAETSMSKFASGIKSHLAAAFSVGAVTAGINRIIDYADAVGDAAQELGITTDEVQGLDFVLKRNNSTIEKGILALNNLDKARREALQDPEGSAAKAFSFFGISQGDLTGRSRLQLMEQISERMKETQRTSVELGHSMEIFGQKMASAIRPSLEEGFKNAADRAREAKELLESIDLKRLKDAKDELKGWQTKGIVLGGEALADIRKNPLLALLTGGRGLAERGFESLFGNRQTNPADVAGDKGKTLRAQRLQREAEEAELKKLAAGAEAERAKKKKEDEKPEIKKIDKPTIETDSLVRVGNFLGASGQNNIVAIQQKQLEYGKRTAMGVEKLLTVITKTQASGLLSGAVA